MAERGSKLLAIDIKIHLLTITLSLDLSTQLWCCTGLWMDNHGVRCQPWRAKRRLVDPSSREAALFSRRALRQRENKVGLRTRRPVIWEPSTEQQRACEVVAQCLVTRTAGAQIGCQRPSRFWGLGCPKIYHEAEDTLVCFVQLPLADIKVLKEACPPRSRSKLPPCG